VRRRGFGLSAAALVLLMAGNVSTQSVTAASGTVVDEQRG
jgi:hypothetical protein